MVGIFALSRTASEVFSKLGIFLWFGLGFGLPLLALSLLSGAAQLWITRQFAARARNRSAPRESTNPTPPDPR